MEEPQKKILTIRNLGVVKEVMKNGVEEISFEQFVRKFRLLVVAEVNQRAYYTSSSCRDTSLEGGFFKIDIED